MPNINDKNVKPETTTEKVSEKTVKETKPRKPREKVRPTVECLALPLSKLTDKEKDNLIKELKEAVSVATNKEQHYKANAESAFEQTRQMEEQFKAMEKYYKDQLKYVSNQLSAFNAAVNRALIIGGME